MGSSDLMPAPFSPPPRLRRYSPQGGEIQTPLWAAVALATVLFAGRAMAEELRPLCPDRPSKGTSACTVDAGHIQVEADLADLTHDASRGVTTDAWAFASPTLKLGVTDSFDIEANLAPYVLIRTHDRTSGARSTVSGIGDLFLRAKLNLAGNAGGALGLALEPWIKAPTAPLGVGDGAWEGGLLAPISYNLPKGWSLGVTPEADVIANGSGSGRHLAVALPVGLGHAVGPIAATLELWTSQDFDPAGTTRQYSLDFAAAWQPPRQPNLQLDGGVHLGLNSATPDLQVYVGVARRF